MIQIFDYKPEASEILEKMYRPCLFGDVYISKSLENVHQELCNVLPAKNFEHSDLYEVLKNLGYTAYAGDEGVFEFRFVAR